MFEKAARMKLRFGFRGQSSAEDLWDLSVEDLDGLYQTLRAEQRDLETESLLKKRNSRANVVGLRVDIVKHIATVKLAETDAAEAMAQNKLRKQKILEIIATKQDADLESQSVEDLTKLLNELG